MSKEVVFHNRKRWQIWLSLFALLCVLWTDPTKSRRALRALEKGNFSKAEEILSKITAKDSLSPSAYYVYARLYSTDRYSRYHLDSAYRYVLSSLQMWSLLNEKEKKKHRKKGFQFEIILKLKAQIDSLAFAEVEAVSTEEAYSLFLSRHTTSAQRLEALRRRDSLAFVDAKSTHSSTAYRSFIKKYPNAKEQTEANKLYEEIRYQESIQGAPLQQIKSFLQEFPYSVYRSAAERKLLELICLQADPLSFLYFLEKYPTSVHTKKVLQLLASIDSAWHKKKYFSRYSSHSLYLDLVEKFTTSADTLFPIFDRNGYGFMDKNGELRILPQYDSISSIYFCEGLKTSYLHLHQRESDELRDRSGKILLRGKINDISSLGADLLAVQIGEKYGLWHLSVGELLPPQYEEITYLSAGFLRLKIDKKVGLGSLFGKWLLPPTYREIQQEGPFLLVEVGDSVLVGLPNELILARQEGRKPQFQIFKEVEVIEEKYLIGRNNQEELLLDSLLRPLFLHSSTDLYHAGNYWVSEENTSFRILRTDSLISSSSLLNVDFNRHWLILQQQDKSYGLLPLSSQDSLPSSKETSLKRCSFLLDSILVGYDSLYLVGSSIAVGRTAEKQLVYFPKQSPLQVSPKARVYALPLPKSDSVHHFYRIVDSSSHLLLDERGHIISKHPYKHIRPLSKKYLIVEESSKEKGIIDKNGKLQTPLIHKTISYPDSTGQLSLLRKNKFGSFYLPSGYYLAADYDEVPLRFGNLGWKVRYRKKTGVLNNNRRARISFRYQDLTYFSSTHYLAKKENQWTLRSYSKKNKVQGPFEEYKILQKEQEKWLLLKEKEGWGLMNKETNWLIEPKYEEIVAVSNPLLAFLAIRYVEDAQLYLAIYFSTTGKYLHAESYDKWPQDILCEK